MTFSDFPVFGHFSKKKIIIEHVYRNEIWLFIENVTVDDTFERCFINFGGTWNLGPVEFSESSDFGILS